MSRIVPASWLLGLIALAAPTAARANVLDAWTVNVQVTSDSDTQQARVGGGARIGKWKLGAVVDAQPWSDGSDDIDAVAEYSPCADSWALLAGWRTAIIAIERGQQWQQQMLVGVVGNLPALFDGRIQPSVGANALVAVVRHGDELATDWISLASGRHVKDTISLNLVVRFEYAGEL